MHTRPRNGGSISGGVAALVCLGAITGSAGCAPQTGVAARDASTRDSAGSAPDSQRAQSDVAAERESGEPCNGLDDDRDSRVDEDCPCASGERQPCFAGDPSLAGVGACVRGTQSCLLDREFGTWAECVGSGGQSEEVCADGIDDDCDGIADEGCVPSDCRPGDLPEPEICDRVDNDCDAEVDEGCEPALPYGRCDERCEGETRVFFNAAYGLWVQVVLCSPSRYDILLGASESGPFRKVGDDSNHGEDHCELVSPSFTLDDDGDENSGSCTTCSVPSAGSVTGIPELLGTPMYVRQYFGEAFELESAERWGIHTACWYECGVSF
jgi:hypothetical protein